jgi:hypothetical protein
LKIAIEAELIWLDDGLKEVFVAYSVTLYGLVKVLNLEFLRSSGSSLEMEDCERKRTVNKKKKH